MLPLSRGLAMMFAALAVSLPAASQEVIKKLPKAVPIVDPKDGGLAYLVQGEYEGTIGSDKFGVQVVALNMSAFDVNFLKGGLPGAGWDMKTKIKATATLDADAKSAAIKGKGIAGTIVVGDPAKLTAKFDDLGDAAFVHVERKSPTLGAKPPEGAIILFDGKNADEWKEKRIENGLLPVAANTKKTFKEMTLHLEFRTPFEPQDRGQGRGNSGVYLYGRNEVQVLDSFGLNGEKNECGALYNRRSPSVNMCFPPLSWQTYDIDVKADPKDAKKYLLSVRHNGVAVHENVEIQAVTGPINLQNHGDAVFYRNIWVVEPGEKK